MLLTRPFVGLRGFGVLSATINSIAISSVKNVYRKFETGENYGTIPMNKQQRSNILTNYYYVFMWPRVYTITITP